MEFEAVHPLPAEGALHPETLPLTAVIFHGQPFSQSVATRQTRNQLRQCCLCSAASLSVMCYGSPSGGWRIAGARRGVVALGMPLLWQERL
jgi:hypothetical protein